MLHAGPGGLRPLIDALAAHPAVTSDGEAAALAARLRERVDATLDDAIERGLGHAAAAFGLSPWEVSLLRLALHATLEPEAAPLYARIAPGRREPTAALAAELFPLPPAARPGAFAFLAEREPLRAYGLLHLDAGPTLSERPVRLAEAMLGRLCGAAHVTPVYPLVPVDAPAVPAPDAAVQALRAGGVVFVAGPEGSGRETLAHAIASAAGFPLLVVPAAEVPADRLVDVRRDARWWGAALRVVAGGHAVVTDTGRPAVVIGTPEDRVPELGQGGPPVVVVQATRPDAAGRARVWAALAARHGVPVDAAARARRHPVRPARVDAALGLAARFDGPPDERVDAALRAVAHPRFGRLATPLDTAVRDDDLVASAAVRRELDLAEAWIRHGSVVFGTARGPRGAGAGHGPVCLFHGPPGTGKTLAARVLAGRVGAPLYRIDLSQVVDKYIGETEKHLARLFDEAREADAILLFDEADALFGKRTGVSDAQDRYANVETGFLLQRLEEHEGPVVLTTNLFANLDDAFLRRIHVVASFAMPTPAELRALWDRHLPVERAPDVSLELLAERFALSGGEVRNATTTAALLAARADRLVGMAECVVGAVRETRKSGRLFDLARLGPWRGVVQRWEGGDPWP